ncbi:L,D-transpeptidase family protein [Streptomyces sp. NPDC101160]|uniref:L,D-transpeptidase family protein n=1 Tax=Streptomyces sp. NPDC101160 TaxID=3366118 RepID=UPI0037F18DDB
MPVRKGTATVLTCALTGVLALTGCAAAQRPPAAPPAMGPAKPTAQAGPDTTHRAPASAPASAPPHGSARARGPARVPGVGPVTQARIPDDAGQVLVVSGDSADGNVATAVLYERGPAGRWRRAAGPWTGHNALNGWTDDHVVGDLRSPTGVFRLGDAGGRLPDPGSRLPYDQDEEFDVSGTGFLGEDLEGSFDYVVAIDYNRVPGTTPLNKERPLGPEKGGGVWIHVDHGGPTQACVSLPRENMEELLRALDPTREPVVVMGPAPVIGR